MASLSLLSGDNSLLGPQLVLEGGRVEKVGSSARRRHRGLSASSSYGLISFPTVEFRYISFCAPKLTIKSRCKSRDELGSDTEIRATMNVKSGDDTKTTPFGEVYEKVGVDKKTNQFGDVNGEKWKRISLRSFRPLPMLSINGLSLNGLGRFLRKNSRKLGASTTICVALGLCYGYMKLGATRSPQVVMYTDLTQGIHDGTVTTVLIEETAGRSGDVYFNTKSWSPEENQKSDGMVARKGEAENLAGVRKLVESHVWKSNWQYSTRRIDHEEVHLLDLLKEKGVRYGFRSQPILLSMKEFWITVLPQWLHLAFMVWFFYAQFSIGKSKAKKWHPSNNMVGFNDAEGVDAAKVELMEIVSCLRGDSNYKKLRAKLPRGVLMVGPPGTGKTLLARAVAGEVGVPFFFASASEFVEVFSGRGAARVRELFDRARKSAPSIIFIDELDAVGGKRGRSFNDERDQTLNQLLTEMDGFDSDMKLVVIAATNRPETLDPALCRPGRFSRKVVVGEPDEIGRRKILAVHLRGVPLEEDIDLTCNLIASQTHGFVGADLADIVNEATLLAARRGGECVSNADIMAAVERVKFGVNGRRQNADTVVERIREFQGGDTTVGGMRGFMGY